VVNHDGGDRVLRVVEALLRQRYPLAEVVVVDNQSNDGSPQRIRTQYPGVRVLDMGANRGLSVARNAGLRSVDTPLTLLVDHDVYVEDGAIAAMVEAYGDQRPAVICPRIRLIPERDVVQAEGAAVHFLGTMILRHAYQSVATTVARQSLVGGCIGACLLVDRARILAAGGFDELYFFYFEDLEFSLRLRAMGHQFLCEPHAEVFHERGTGTPGLSFRGAGTYPIRRAHLTMRNRLLTIFIHYRLRTLLLLLPVLMLYEVATLAVAVRKGWVRPWARAWLWQFRNGRAIALRRRRMRGLRREPDRNLLVGGEVPLAPGMVESPLERWLVTLLSRILGGYWWLARSWIA
jgi:GT2 family glycosyltransferase